MLDTGLKILIVASEVAPFAKTGGLADVAGSLPKALAVQGNDVRVVLPRYRPIGDYRTVTDFPVQVGRRKDTCIVRQSRIEAKYPGGMKEVPVYFVDNYHYFDRERFYGYEDDAERFAFFNLSVIPLCDALGFRPDIIHLNDWQSGFVPLLLRIRARHDTVWNEVATVFTVHNLQYQGRFPRETLALLGLGDEYFTPGGVEYYGDVSFMKAGLLFSDVIGTVSQTYAKEIQTPEFGEGLDGVLRKRGSDLYGIVNGINYHEYDPSSDPRVYRTYDSRDLDGKRENKHALQRELGLNISDEPLVGMVSRLADQKGLDILLKAIPEVLGRRLQFVLLGSGDGRYEEAFRSVAASYPERVSVTTGFNGILAQRIYAGSDMFLMPSRFEPCGLGQLIAMRYGSIPIARRTGGIADTVSDYDASTGTGTGFLFNRYSAEGLLAALDRALEKYADRQVWNHIVKQAMESDFSWNKSAAMYTEVYMEAMARRGRVERPA
ncbi:MAG: glycogen synthase GlgA [Bacillota bacterium]|jgi:starch synthase|nr:glycogen synthase GlgA [Candidatus Fermentithermobacillaceae bacterium]